MKTIVLEELNIPEDRRQALKREAMRRRVSLNVLVSEYLGSMADKILASARRGAQNTVGGQG